MTAIQMGITIAVCTAATMLTRFLPFVVFSSKDQQPPEVVWYLGRVLPAAIFGMLIVYCLKSVTPFAGSHGAPEAIALLVTVALHKWKHETLLSVTGGAMCCWCSWYSDRKKLPRHGAVPWAEELFAQ